MSEPGGIYYRPSTIATLAEQLLIACRQARDVNGQRLMVRGDESRAEAIATKAIADLIGHEFNLLADAA